MQQYLTFALGAHVYAVNAAHINSILDPQGWAPLPASATLVKGLANVRGNVVPIFDPGRLLGEMVFDLPGVRAASIAPVAEMDGGIIIFEIENATHLPLIGMEVERVGKVCEVDDDHIQPVPAYLSEEIARHYAGFYLQDDAVFSIISLKELVSRRTLFQGVGGNNG